jgi:colanic acid/amylovoran biosynthesis glycosyltransferase
LKTVVIYKDELLPMSETFIITQGSALTRYKPQYVGVFRAEKSLDIPGNPIIALPSSGKFEPIRILYYQTGFAPRFFRALRQVNPDVIHAHFASCGRNAVRLAQVLRRPLVVSLHGHDVMMKRDFRKEYSKLWEVASAFICVSKNIRAKALEDGFPPEKLRLVYNGIIPDPVTDAVPEKDENLILFVGRLVEKKGCIYLVRAMAAVKKACPDARLVLIGEGPLRPALEAEAAAQDIPCTFLGSQPPEVVRRYQKQAAIACIPSVTAEDGDSEALPTVILEAMTAGTTVVASTHGGAREAIVDGETGLLVSERNAEELAAALIRALQNSGLRLYMRDKGQTLVREHFDVRKLAKNLEDIYDEVSDDAMSKEQVLMSSSAVS